MIELRSAPEKGRGVSPPCNANQRYIASVERKTVIGGSSARATEAGERACTLAIVDPKVVAEAVREERHRPIHVARREASRRVEGLVKQDVHELRERGAAGVSVRRLYAVWCPRLCVCLHDVCACGCLAQRVCVGARDVRCARRASLFVACQWRPSVPGDCRSQPGRRGVQGCGARARRQWRAPSLRGEYTRTRVSNIQPYASSQYRTGVAG